MQFILFSFISTLFSQHCSHRYSNLNCEEREGAVYYTGCEFLSPVHERCGNMKKCQDYKNRLTRSCQ